MILKSQTPRPICFPTGLGEGGGAFLQGRLALCYAPAQQPQGARMSSEAASLGAAFSHPEDFRADSQSLWYIHPTLPTLS